MSKIYLVGILFLAAISAVACSQTSNSNAINVNTTRDPGRTNTASPDPERTPPGVDPTPFAPPANSAALPANTNSTARVEKTQSSAAKSKASTTEKQSDAAIPSAEEMQKVFNKPPTVTDVNTPGMMKGSPIMRGKPAASPTMKSNSANPPMMKTTRKPGGNP